MLNLVGDWECTAVRGSCEEFALLFSASDRPRSPVAGELIVNGRRTPIQGRWVTIRDPDQHRILGILLEVVEGRGVPREFEIPFHRLLGEVVVGTGEDKLIYTSRKRSE